MPMRIAVRRLPFPAATALDQTAMLELIDEANHHVAMNAHGVGQVLLGLALD